MVIFINITFLFNIKVNVFPAHNWFMRQRSFFTMKHAGCLESMKGKCSLKTFSTQQFECKQCAVNQYKSSILCLWHLSKIVSFMFMALIERRSS